jgi:hypothetical protein
MAALLATLRLPVRFALQTTCFLTTTAFPAPQVVRAVMVMPVFHVSPAFYLTALAVWPVPPHALRVRMANARAAVPATTLAVLFVSSVLPTVLLVSPQIPAPPAKRTMF